MFRIPFARKSAVCASSPFLLLCYGSVALAGDYSLIRIAERVGSSASSEPSTPVIGNGEAYWHDSGSSDPSGGGSVINSYPGGLIATDTRTLSEEGDFPVGDPLDARDGKLLVMGRYFVPAGGTSFSIYDSLYEYPGGSRRLYPFSDFPGDITGSGNIQLGASLYDTGGSIVFFFRQTQPSNAAFTALGRLIGGSVTVLARSGVTQVPGTTTAFSLIGRFSTDGGVTIFYGEGAGKRGIYQISSGGAISKVLENGDPEPTGAGGTVGIQNDASTTLANEGADLVIARGDTSGWVYKRKAGVWTRVVKAGDPIPGGSGDFFTLSAPSIHGGKAMFFGGRDNKFSLPLQLGIYVETNQGIRPVVDLSSDFGNLAVRSLLLPAAGGRYWDGEKVVFNVVNSPHTHRANYIAVQASREFRINSFDRLGAGGTGRLSFQSEAGVSYRVEESTNLKEWTTSRTVAGNGSLLSVEGLPLSGPKRFFRLATP